MRALTFVSLFSSVVALAIAFAGMAGLFGPKIERTTIALHGQKQPRDCRRGGNTCAVSIHVRCDDTSNEPQSCEPYPVLTEEAQVIVANAGQTITFDIADNTFKFDATNGISSTDLTGCNGNANKFTCKVPMQSKVSKYSIQLQGMSPVDPWVVN